MSQFNIPVQQYAGFTPQQQQAFQQYSDLQNVYQPYYNQANSYFNQSAAPITGSDVSNYLNPYAGYVLGNLSEQQGQQMNQLTGSATQTAGGVGADRIGVAQGELARQQGLATGQTLSGIYGSALSAAQQQKQMEQSAGYGLGNLGASNLNSALSATNALYGSGTAQQNLSQNRLNAEYTNKVQQAAYPFETAQYLANVTSGLSGALGGTTNTTQTGTGTTQNNNNTSLWSQLFGAGLSGVGLVGATKGFGSNGWLSNLFGNSGTSNTSSRGGRIGYDDGGSVGSADAWLNSDPAVPSGKITQSQVNVPKITPLNLSTGSGSGSSSSSGSSTLGDISSIAKIAAMFARGGRMPMPQHFDDGGEVINPDNPYTMTDPAAVQRWRDNTPVVQPTTNMTDTVPSDDATIPPKAKPTQGNTNPYADLSPAAGDVAAQNRREMPDTSYSAPYNIDHNKDESRTFGSSPWMPVIAAGLGIMGGTSPYAGVNIGKGGLEGLKAVEAQRKESREEESVNQRARQLAMNAQQYTRMTPKEAADIELRKETNEQAKWQLTYDARTGKAYWTKAGETPIPALPGSGPPTLNTPPQATLAPPPAPSATAPNVTPNAAPAPQATPPNAAPNATPSSTSAAPATNTPASSVSDKLDFSYKGPGEKDPGPVYNPRTGVIDPVNKSVSDKDIQDSRVRSRAAAETELQVGQLERALTTVDELNKKGPGWLNTGTGATQRIAIAKAINTIAAPLGEQPVDPQLIGSSEEAGKITTRLGFALSRTLGSREAQQVVRQAIEANPGIENTPEGRRYIIESIRAAAEMDKDYSRFVNEHYTKWGTTRGAEDEFHRLNPPEKYAVHAAINAADPKFTKPEVLSKAVEYLRAHADDPDTVALFNKRYRGTAAYFLKD